MVCDSVLCRFRCLRTDCASSSTSAIQKIGKRLSLRQQVVATAVVYLRRFYLKNSYCGKQTEQLPVVCLTHSFASIETDLPLVAAACVYVAAKAEETAIHIKVVVTEARATFSGTYICP